jgi:tetratricopeptide (TPR) repeat protein
MTESQDITQVLQAQGEAARQRSHYLDAQHCYELALARRTATLGADHAECLPLLTALGEIMQTQAQYPEAERYYLRALTLCEQTYGQQHVRTATAIGDLAGIWEELGRLDQAHVYYEKALQLTEQVQGPDHPDTAIALSKVARFYRVVGKNDQAHAFFIRALTIYEQQPDDAAKAIMLNNLAYLHITQGRYAQAETLLRRAIRINTLLEREQYTFVRGINIKNVAAALRGQQEIVLAEILEQYALRVYEMVLGTAHPDAVALRALLMAYEKEASDDE